MDERPIFVGGLSRCGKSLMAALLSSHPNIAFSTKGSNLWTRFYRRYGDLSRPRSFERCLAAVLHYDNLSPLGPDPDRIRAEFWVGQPSYARLFALLHGHYAKQLGKPRWGDQSRSIEHYAKPIFAAYPGAKMIHMIRDPRDRHAEASVRKTYGRGSVGSGTARWLCSLHLAKRNQERYRGCYKIVRYESLVSEPEVTLRDVCAFLGEEYVERMLAMSQVAEYRVKGGNKLDGKDGRGNVSTAFVGRYRDRMTQREIAFMQTYARSGMLWCGYQLDPVQATVGDFLRYDILDQLGNLAIMIAWFIWEEVRFRSRHPIAALAVG